MTESYPLIWPAGWKRTESHRRERSRFGTGWNAKPTVAYALNELKNELRLLGAKSIVISTNVELKRDGDPYSGRRAPDDVGVAAYFVLDGHNQCIPCDKWDKVGCNLWAVAKTVSALRGIERWGAKDMVNAAFSGFKALPSPDMVLSMPVSRAWYEVLGVSPDAPMSVRKAAYRALSKSAHPDMGGSASDWAELQNAWKEGARK